MALPHLPRLVVEYGRALHERDDQRQATSAPPTARSPDDQRDIRRRSIGHSADAPSTIAFTLTGSGALTVTASSSNTAVAERRHLYQCRLRRNNLTCTATLLRPPDKRDIDHISERR